jgi:hypothetical protein
MQNVNARNWRGGAGGGKAIKSKGGRPFHQSLRNPQTAIYWLLMATQRYAAYAEFSGGSDSGVQLQTG